MRRRKKKSSFKGFVSGGWEGGADDTSVEVDAILLSGLFSRLSAAFVARRKPKNPSEQPLLSFSISLLERRRTTSEEQRRWRRKDVPEEAFAMSRETRCPDTRNREENQGGTIDRLSGHEENERRMVFSSLFGDRSWQQTRQRSFSRIERNVVQMKKTSGLKNRTSRTGVFSYG